MNSSILLTGATGAVGSSVAEALRRDPEIRLVLLIRARSAEHLAERFRSLCEFWGTAPAAAASPVEVQAGDVALPNLGLDPPTYERLAATVTRVVHMAGCVSLNRPWSEARRDAVEATAEVLRFCRAAQSRGSFRRLDYFSTVGVCGRTRGSIPEGRLTHPRRFRNTYEAAKSEAEDLVWEAIARGLPATIFRPSMVVGHQRTGEIFRFQIFYHLIPFLSGQLTGGVVPRTGDLRLDLVPVDYVAQAVALTGDRLDSLGKVFHLCAGPTQAPRLREVARDLREILRGLGESLPPLQPLNRGVFRGMLPLLAEGARERTGKTLSNLDLFLDYLEDEQVFENTETQAYFRPLGLDTPPVDSYLERIVRFYRKRVPLGPASFRLTAVARPRSSRPVSA